MATQYTPAQRRQHIYHLQTALRRVMQEQDGGSPIVPDGIYGEETRQAVLQFQRQNELSETGVADFDTWSAIFTQSAVLQQQDTAPTPAYFYLAEMREGSRGRAVMALQLMLGTLALHFENIEAPPTTGIYDSATAAAVRIVQRTGGLPATGVTDRITWDTVTRLHNVYYEKTPLQWEQA